MFTLICRLVIVISRAVDVNDTRGKKYPDHYYTERSKDKVDVCMQTSACLGVKVVRRQSFTHTHAHTYAGS